MGVVGCVCIDDSLWFAGACLCVCACVGVVDWSRDGVVEVGGEDEEEKWKKRERVGGCMYACM